MRKYLIGLCAASVVLLQAQAALANCTQAEIAGTWRLVGTNMAGTPASPMGFVCSAVVIQKGTGTTKYKIGNTSCTQHVNGVAPMPFTLSANNTIVINSATCAISGTFKFGATDFPPPFTFTVIGQVAENPAVGNKTSASGIATSGANNDFISVFTLMR
jgi:hypothetical protein